MTDLLSDKNLKTKRVLLWTAPRSLSTAFQLSIGTLPQVKSILEPYTPPYYRSKPIRVMPNSPLNYSFEDADKMILASFKDFTHSFLIRNPQRAVPSFYKALDYNLETFLELYERGDVGFECLYEFYEFLKSHLGINPIIIDADELLANPEQMLEAYCKNVGLTYREGMTKWEPWPHPKSGWHELKEMDFFTFPPDNHVWFGTAINSSGFGPPKPLPPIPEDLPFAVKRCIEESLVAYNKLFSYRMTI